jgi:hypothetical protein
MAGSGFHLNRSYQGLYIPAMVWREIDNFSSDAVCLALASAYFDEADYYRDYDVVVKDVKGFPCHFIHAIDVHRTQQVLFVDR